jgi:hypothetical protein
MATGENLSCSKCRQRKIKCDKTRPRCNQCARAELDCVFPSRKKNRKPRRDRHDELMNRINRLESIVGQIDSSQANAISTNDTSSTPMLPPPAPAARSEPVPRGVPSGGYLSGEFWMTLGDEVEGLKQALEQKISDSEDEDGGTESSPASMDTLRSRTNSSGLILSTPASFGTPDRLSHPSPSGITLLCKTFFSNVDPVVKILHRPSVMSMVDSFLAAGQPNPTNFALNALLFAIYYGAVTSLSNEKCLSELREDRATLVDRLRHGAESALAQADYLETDDLMTLQALILYVVRYIYIYPYSRIRWSVRY